MAIAKHTKFPGPDTPSWELTPRGDGYFRIQISRSTLIAFIVSLLLHLLLLVTLAPRLLNTKPITAEHQSLVIRLVPPNRAQAKTSPAPNIAAIPKPATHQLHKASPALASPPVTKDEFAAPNNHSGPSLNPSPPPTDMMAYVNAKRAHREATEKLTGHENSIADSNEREPTEDEQRTATIKRNLQQGTNGLFQIISLSARSAEFSFRGWTNDLSYSKRQVIDVETAPGVDIRRAVVRRMIELIRTYYSGDFNWESIRLNRVIVLSARVEDNAGLEDFLLAEFFGSAAGIPAN